MKPRLITVISCAAMILAATSAVSPQDAVPGQEAAPDCVQGNLKNNYLGRECTLGVITIKFDKDFGGASAVDPANVMVTPTADPPTLRFEFPTVTPAKGGSVSILYLSELRSSLDLTKIQLSGELGGKNVKVAVSVVGLPEKSRDSSGLELQSFVELVRGALNPARKMLRVVYSLQISEEAHPVFAVSLSGGK